MNTRRGGLAGLVWALAAVGTAPVRAQTATEVVLHNFGRLQGASLSTGLVRDPAGNLYGTASTGGPMYDGVVYEIDTAGNYTVLYSFTGGADGRSPTDVVLDSAGNLYGTTSYGGPTGWAGPGVVYKLDRTGHETVLYSFTGHADGGYPNGVVRDAAGNLYGTTVSGGSGDCTPVGSLSGCGVVFKLDAAGNYTLLYSFTDGGSPSGVIRDPAGSLYGTNEYGGAHFRGAVYKIDTSGHYTELYSFTGEADGGLPSAGVVRDPAGNLYGTTRSGGSDRNCPLSGNLRGCGVVYKLDAAGNFTVLYRFTDGNTGGLPDAGVTLDSAGNLYGTRPYTSSATGGTVYKLDTAGNYTVLYDFTGGGDGSEPLAGVILDPLGDLYGTTYYGGATNGGVVYKVSTGGHETVLHSFPNGGFGSSPWAGVTRDGAGDLYGTTYQGGRANLGTVYKLDRAGGYTAMYSFSGASDGAAPTAGVLLDPAGNLYGTASSGGSTCNCGVAYELDTAGQEVVLYAFTGGADGRSPYAGLIHDDAGNLYGTTLYGGFSGGLCKGTAAAVGCGVVYKLDAGGHETVLHTFTPGSDGLYPYAGVIRDAAGNLYGTTEEGGTAGGGVVYKLDPSGSYSVLYNFTGGADGGRPMAGVIRDGIGNLYGTTTVGGTAGSGVVFKLDATGNYTVLYTFTGGPDGAGPVGVIRDASGNLYGTTASPAVVYKLDSAGHYTVLRSFTCGAGGCSPNAGLLRDSSGNLFGTTSQGGKRGTGIVFKLEPQ